MMGICHKGAAQTVRIADYQDFEKLRNSQADTLYVFNFWATWCKPCVEELPAYQKIRDQYKSRNLKLILVSMDSYKEEKRVSSFLKNHHYTSEPWLVKSSNMNGFINNISPDWSGALPLTVFSHPQKQIYFIGEHTFEFKELSQKIDSLFRK